jgi:hypothetical protein
MVGCGVVGFPHGNDAVGRERATAIEPERVSSRTARDRAHALPAVPHVLTASSKASLDEPQIDVASSFELKPFGTTRVQR